MDNPVAKALHDGLDTLRRRGWAQGQLCDGHGRVCARGALLASAGMAFYFPEIRQDATLNEADRLLCAVADEQYPDRSGWLGDAIAYVNNDDDTTQEDVERIFEKAIVKAYETL